MRETLLWGAAQAVEAHRRPAFTPALPEMSEVAASPSSVLGGAVLPGFSGISDLRSGRLLSRSYGVVLRACCG